MHGRMNLMLSHYMIKRALAGDMKYIRVGDEDKFCFKLAMRLDAYRKNNDVQVQQFVSNIKPPTIIES